MLYAVAQGFFLGAASEAFEQWYPASWRGRRRHDRAFIATLAAYKFFNIQVTSRMRKWVTIAGMGFFVLVFGDFLLGLFDAELGFNEFGALGLIMSVVGLGLGIFFLILDFDMIERGRGDGRTGE